MGGGAGAVAVLVEDGFDERELDGICTRLVTAGVEAVLVGPIADRQYTGRQGLVGVTSQMAPRAAGAHGFAAVVIPGGYAPDRIRMRHGLLDLVRDTIAAGRPVAAVGHGAQVLISAGVVRGRTLTCWPSIAIDVQNAGGLYVDRPVAEDGPVLTARKADDVPLLIAALLRAMHHAA